MHSYFIGLLLVLALTMTTGASPILPRELTGRAAGELDNRASIGTSSANRPRAATGPERLVLSASGRGGWRFAPSPSEALTDQISYGCATSTGRYIDTSTPHGVEGKCWLSPLPSAEPPSELVERFDPSRIDSEGEVEGAGTPGALS
ncbi:hypothetical protein B0H17DRAFT_1126434 [Mycena rosella]|uniref:Secreted protein n=1 Tax=Mycena rosella TaxID=1033263 RepID=A0AAD7M7M1_MYCRO|nr:hypothetical protein B0H17DRAFT_1126434 [Mycena rosella]